MLDNIAIVCMLFCSNHIIFIKKRIKTRLSFWQHFLPLNFYMGLTDYWNDRYVTSHFSSSTRVWLTCEVYPSPLIAADRCASKAVWLGMCAPSGLQLFAQDSLLSTALWRRGDKCRGQSRCDSCSSTWDAFDFVAAGITDKVLLHGLRAGTKSGAQRNLQSFWTALRSCWYLLSQNASRIFTLNKPKFVFLNVSESFCILIFLLPAKVLNYWNSCTGHYGLAEGISG